MNEHANPLDYILRCAEQGLVPKLFNVQNAKDELKKLRNRPEYDIAAWARLNQRGDLYDLRICHNPYVDQNIVIPLYFNREEFKEKYGKLFQ